MTKGSLLPEHQVCPLCVRDDQLTIVALAPGAWQYTCSNLNAHGGKLYTWLGTAISEKEKEEVEGKAAELGLYDDLPACLVAGEPFVEYGVVEYRFSRQCPEVFRRLLSDYSHTRIERNKPYTAASFIAAALGRMDDWGSVVLRYGKATGHWSYNEVISYWALPPGPPTDSFLTWEDFASASGLDPFHWILESA